MKIQDVKKQCEATVGVSIEFSNREVSSIARVVWELDREIDKAVQQQISVFSHPMDDKVPLSVEDNVIAYVDLKVLLKAAKLLHMMCSTREESNLFADSEMYYAGLIDEINAKALPKPQL